MLPMKEAVARVGKVLRYTQEQDVTKSEAWTEARRHLATRGQKEPNLTVYVQRKILDCLEGQYHNLAPLFALGWIDVDAEGAPRLYPEVPEALYRYAEHLEDEFGTLSLEIAESVREGGPKPGTEPAPFFAMRAAIVGLASSHPDLPPEVVAALDRAVGSLEPWVDEMQQLTEELDWLRDFGYYVLNYADRLPERLPRLLDHRRAYRAHLGKDPATHDWSLPPAAGPVVQEALLAVADAGTFPDTELALEPSQVSAIYEFLAASGTDAKAVIGSRDPADKEEAQRSAGVAAEGGAQ